MTEKELRHMGRAELIEIIVAQKERELVLQKRLEKADQLLGERILRIDHAGSIAEASLALNGVFEAAQAAADTYLESIKTANAEITKRKQQAREECDRMLREAEEEAKALVQAAEKQCSLMFEPPSTAPSGIKRSRFRK